MTRKVWMLWRPETAKRVELESHDDVTWPDNYVHEYVRMQSGEITYITDGVTIYRVYCLVDGQAFLTEPFTEDAARKEVQECTSLNT